MPKDTEVMIGIMRVPVTAPHQHDGKLTFHHRKTAAIFPVKGSKI